MNMLNIPTPILFGTLNFAVPPVLLLQTEALPDPVSREVVLIQERILTTGQILLDCSKTCYFMAHP